MKDPYIQSLLARPTRRIMVFVDGENLVLRYQAMLRRGFIPRSDDVLHIPDVCVWHRSFTFSAQQHEILRVTYYTYASGDEARLDDIRRHLRTQNFSKHMASLLPDTVTPRVFKKGVRNQKAKGVDIQLAVDVLGHVYRKNVDAVLIMSGDGDFAPLIEEAKRGGVQVYLSAFSDGLSPSLRNIVDHIYELDGTMWT